jgi:hypothetical protein
VGRDKLITVTSFVHRRATASLILACVALSLEGCTIVGAGIGAVIPRRSVEMPADIRTLPPGIDVTVVYRRRPEKPPSGAHAVSPPGAAAVPCASALSTVEGVYRGIEDQQVMVERTHDAYGIPLSQIEQTRARPATGSYSLEGGLIGLGLDVATVIFLYTVVSRGIATGDQ